MSTRPAHSIPRTVVVRLATLLAIAFAAPTAQSAAPGSRLDDVPVDALKSVYLACSRAALDGRLDNAALMQCSVVYEALKQRAFDGDFGKLLAWSRAQPSAQKTAR